MVVMREAMRGVDDAAVWAVLRPSVEAGDTFCADPEGGMAGGLAYFWPESARVWLAEVDGEILGCCYLRPNQTGNGAHVCNAGYCTLPEARGRGVARAMLAHSLDVARSEGYRAMQYNFVVETNHRAIETWERAGFAIVGRLPGAFLHPAEGYVDALVMYRDLTT
ncbi:GNAT family N-acetyltransferase [Rhodobacteraceae bacterium LMO-12]|nr:GNAT family N-acetyltransferase [Rhodobacteraceae bacterium LMO-JJ12]